MLINRPSSPRCCVSIAGAQSPQRKGDVAAINSGIDRGQFVGQLSLFWHPIRLFFFCTCHLCNDFDGFTGLRTETLSNGAYRQNTRTGGLCWFSVRVVNLGLNREIFFRIRFCFAAHRDAAKRTVRIANVVGAALKKEKGGG